MTQAEKLAELEARMLARMERLEKRQDAADAMRIDTHKMVGDVQGTVARMQTTVANMQTMVSDMHRALMEPPSFDPDQKSLVARMAEVTVSIESGKRTADNVIWVGKLLVALTIVAGVFAAIWNGSSKD